MLPSVLISLLGSFWLIPVAARANGESPRPASGAACWNPSRPRSELPGLVEVAGRRVSIWYPQNYDDRNPVPVVIAFHDASHTVKEFTRATQLTNRTLNDFAMVVYPHRKEIGWLSEDNDGLQPLGPLDVNNPGEDDFAWTNTLLTYLTDHFCIDESSVYVAGLGSGGGLAHLLACQPSVSDRIAAFAMVNPGLFKGGEHDPGGVWNRCEVSRKQTPGLEIHSGANARYKYYPKKTDANLKITDWLTMWSEKNACGPIDGPTVPSPDSDAAFVTKLENGQMSEGIGHGGTVTRVSYRCVEPVRERLDEADSAGEGRDDVDGGSSLPSWYGQSTPAWTPKSDLDDAGSIILHYNVQGLGHGWPRQRLTQLDKVVVDGAEVKPPGEPHFDATLVLLQWFRSHALPRDNVAWQIRTDSDEEDGAVQATPASIVYSGETVHDEL